MRAKGATKKKRGNTSLYAVFCSQHIDTTYLYQEDKINTECFYKKRWHFNDSTEHHDWLLSDKVDILSYLLLPLAGPEEFDDDDMEKLPDRIQYLPPDKTREPIAEIRRILLQAILKVSITQ